MALTKKSIGTTKTENVSNDSKVAIKKYFDDLVGSMGKIVAEAIDAGAATLIEKARKDAQAVIDKEDYDSDGEILDALVCIHILSDLFSYLRTIFSAG